MSPSQRRYVVGETLIGMAFGAVLSLGFVWLLFGGQSQVARSAVLLDALPQAFMVALMSTLVPGVLTRRRLRAGSVQPLAGASRLPRTLILRAVLLGLLWMVLAGGAQALLLPLNDPVPAGWIWWGKPLIGALVAAGNGPIALRAALRDRGAPVSATARAA